MKYIAFGEKKYLHNRISAQSMEQKSIQILTLMVLNFWKFT